MMEAVVDIDLIEQQKENILPLTSGRSALQLSSVLTNKSSKLQQQHDQFQLQLDALEEYERLLRSSDGSVGEIEWDESKYGGTSLEDVISNSNDPLDVHQQYARFILNNYPAGASSSSKLIPFLESSTRKFLNDSRYTNDRRYLRLWNLYAKHMESPEDCYRFLFAKGIGEKLSLLYEEYAIVLEAAGKRTQANQIYLLGQHRRTEPRERLKQRHQAFQARMLIAPPLPDSPPVARLSSSTSRDARSILGGAALPSAPVSLSSNSTHIISKSIPVNGAKGFAVFTDTVGEANHLQGGEWNDLGTIKSRQRENTINAVEWKGEVMPMMAKKSGGGIEKLEVFRDDTASMSNTPASVDLADTPFSRSIRGPSEVELLRQNPFKNYSSQDLDLSNIDPLVTAAAEIEEKNEKKEVKKERKSSSSSSSTVKKSSSSSKSTASKSTSSKAAVQSSGPNVERVACPLALIYPSPGVEISLEELKMQSRVEYEIEVQTWKGWQYRKVWQAEMESTGRRSYIVDPVTSWPITHDPVTEEPLYDFIPRPVTIIEDVIAHSPARIIASSPLRPALDSPHLVALVDPIPSLSLPATHDSPAVVVKQKRRPPSPTMNTKQAQFILDNMFSKTINFDQLVEVEDDDDDDDDESEDEDEEEEEVSGSTSFVDSQSQSQTQFDTAFSQHSAQQQQSTQLYEERIVEREAFVPFVDSALSVDAIVPVIEDVEVSRVELETSEEVESEMSAEMIRRPPAAGITSSLLIDMSEAVVEGEEEEIEARGEPLRLFKDVVEESENPSVLTGVTKAKLFRPVMVDRTPFGVKTIGGGASRSLNVIQDHFQEEQEEQEENNLVDLRSAPLIFHDSPPRADGFAMGRRPIGANRYAPLIDNMTPITERTCEFTTSTMTNVSGLSHSQRSRRDSAFPVTEVVLEEDEESEEAEEESDDDDEGDRAFVGEEGADESDRSSYRTRGGSTEEDTEDEEEEIESVRQNRLQPLVVLPSSLLMEGSITTSSSASSFELGKSDSKIEEEEVRLDEEVSIEQSFDTLRRDASLSEGYTIEGNQTGMETGIVFGETTNYHTATTQSLPSSSLLPLVNPFDPSTINRLLSTISPPVLQHPLAHDLSTISANKLDDLQKAAKRRADKAGSTPNKGSSSSSSRDKTGVIEDIWELELDGELFSVREKLGEGSFGAVFRVARLSEDVSFDEDLDEDEETLIAVKVERPRNVWEFYILQQLHSRLSPALRSSVITCSNLYAYSDESFLFLEFCDQGTLLDAVNKANEVGIAPPTGGASNGLEEIMAMFFTIELLKIVEGFHSSGFIHGDLKIDNCLIRLQGMKKGETWSTGYDRTGGGGWSKKGLKLIDFGRTIDLNRFERGQLFQSDFQADEFDCVEMREGKAWTYETDYYGVATIAFSLLFGRFMETKLIECEVDGMMRKKYVISQNFKRYQQAELWTKLFEALLNPKMVANGGELPIINELASVRNEMEDWLERNCDKNGKSLRGLIKKMEIYSLTKYGR